MADSCKRSLEITVPAGEVAEETDRAISSIQGRARLPGFRTGKAPASLIRSRFASEIDEKVIHALVPKHFSKTAEDQNLRVVGTPDISDVHLHAGEPLTFKAEFEVFPDFELGEYHGLAVPYREPAVTPEQIDKRLADVREQKAEFVNEAPRPAADGDFVVASLEALGEVEESLRKQDEVMVQLGGADTLEAWTVNLRGMSPGEEKEFDVPYPEDFGDRHLAGRTIRFRALVTGIRRKELPELNDAFAADLGDFKDLEELREEVRKTLSREQEQQAQQAAKNKLTELLVQAHDFPVPEAMLERQIEGQVRQYLGALAAQGVDISQVKLDWNKVKESQQERAAKEVKATILLDRIAERENIEVTNAEVDREVQRLARLEKEPVAAVRKRLEEDGGIRRIASRIRAEKTLGFLFEHARKLADE